jgi:propionate CoA-transferase
MTESRPPANGKVISVRDAVGLVRDGATVVIGGSGAGHALPQRFIDELATVYEAEGRPRDLTTVRVVGIGDFADRGFSQLGLPGLMRRTIGSNIGNEPRLGALVEANELESYSFPQGVLSELMREIAAGRPGLVTHVGLGTYVDPRQTGGKQNSRTTDDLVEVVTLRGKEWLLFHAFPIDVAVIRGTTADEDGNLTMEGEAVQGEMLAMAMAARNSGGIVIAQVRELARRGSLPLRDVRIPGALVDHVYVDPDQWQTYITQDSPYYSGRLRKPVTDEPPLPLDVRKIIARRSLLEFPRGAICNLGFGISQLIGRVAWEEGVTDQLVLTVEQGIFGGVPVAGNEGGAGFNYQAMIDQPYMFDFYDGGGLDIASLSFAEVDAEGNVNVHAFEGRVRGPGGFPNISARTPRINFVGTLTAQGLELDISGDGVRVVHEGSLPKFVPEVRQISFSGRLARERGQHVRYVTDRAVFALEDDGLVLIEVAPGIDVERDVLGQMGFRPRVADDLREMDRRIYASGPMGLAEDFAAAGPAAAAPTRATAAAR